MNKIVFCDFDGTASRTDVGNLLFKTLAEPGWYDAVEAWKEGKLTSKECLEIECSHLKDITEWDLEEYALSNELDPVFPEFVEYCENRHIQVVILSDGLDFYISRILAKHNLSRIPYYSNNLKFNGDGKIYPSFPFEGKGCGRCGNCKGYHVERLAGNGEQRIYIGDGYSDRCGAEKADIVFARRDLLKYCEENGMNHHPFGDFSDLFPKFKEVIEPK